MVKLLRAHGLRHAERLREDELKVALHELGLALSEGGAGQDLMVGSGATSGRLHPTPAPAPAPEEPPVEEIDERWDDPHAAPFFREPKVHIPEGERTFLRLIAVDWRRLFATWDLAADQWHHLLGGVELRVLPAEVPDLLNPEHALVIESVDARARGWYLEVEDQDRSALVAVLLTFDDGRPRVLATSNVTVVPPARLAPPGPLWFATLSPHADRRRLRGGMLLRALAGEKVELPDGVRVEKTGRTVGPAGQPYEGSASEAMPRRAFEGPGDELPSSGTRAWSGSNPWSGSLARRDDEGGAR